MKRKHSWLCCAGCMVTMAAGSRKAFATACAIQACNHGSHATFLQPHFTIFVRTDSRAHNTCGRSNDDCLGLLRCGCLLLAGFLSRSDLLQDGHQVGQSLATACLVSQQHVLSL